MLYLVWALEVDNFLMDKHLVHWTFAEEKKKWTSEPVLYPISSKVLSRTRCTTGCHYSAGRRRVWASSNGWRVVLVYCGGPLRHIVSVRELFLRWHNRWLIWKSPTEELEPSDVSFTVAKNKHERDATGLLNRSTSWTRSKSRVWEQTQSWLWYRFLSMGASEIYGFEMIYFICVFLDAVSAHNRNGVQIKPQILRNLIQT